MNPVLLDFYSKKNMRSLSNSQYDEAEATKTKIFLSAQPFSNINDDYVSASLQVVQSNNIDQLYNHYINFLNSVKSEFARDLTVQELKGVKSYFYSMVYEQTT